MKQTYLQQTVRELAELSDKLDRLMKGGTL